VLLEKINGVNWLLLIYKDYILSMTMGLGMGEVKNTGLQDLHTMGMRKGCVEQAYFP
jgi:hypothetical protein